MKIRFEQPQDWIAITDTTIAAFAGQEHSDQTEHAIIDRLRGAGALTLSLVAVDQGKVIGHVAFSPVEIEPEHEGWFGLGPVSVLRDRQRTGVGTSLIEQGLSELRSRAAAGCVVLGDPAYYRRFGFENDDALRYADAPAEFFMRLAFYDSVPAGTVRYHRAFYGH
jgi:putative acetyltransferase